MKRLVALSLAIILLASNTITAAEGEPELFAVSEPEFACGTDQGDLYEAHNTLVQQKIAELQEDFGVQQGSVQKDAGATLLGLMPNYGGGATTLMRSTGTVKLLVIPIVYSDQAKYKENFDMEAQYKQFFAPYDNTTNVYLQSVHGYYQRLSYDKLNIIGDVMEPFEAPYTSNYYYTSDTVQTYERRRELLAEALQFYIDQGVDLSHYDTDGDGMLDAVLVKSMCPNRTHYTMAFTDPVEVEGYQAGPFVFMSLTLTDKGNEVTGLTQQVAEHEIGHLMGLLDNYDSNGTTNCFDRELGELMEASQIYSGYINAYYKYLLGWIDPLIVTGEDAVTDLSLFPVESMSDDGANSPKAIVLIPNVNSFPFTEFYIAEYRGGGMYPYASKPAFDKAPGLVIWHANTFLSANALKNYKNKTNYLQPIYKSGTEKYDTKDIYVAGDHFSAATTPNSDFYDGTYTGIYLEITQITPEKASIRAGFDPVNLLPEPVIEVSVPSKKVICEGETATIVITTKVGDELLALDADTARNLYGCSTLGTVKGAGTVSWSASKNPMTVTFKGVGAYPEPGDGAIWVDIPTGAIRYNGKDSAAVTSDKIWIDNTPPEITLLGANPQTIWIGDSYQDMGAVATDNLDSDIDKKLVVDASEVKTDIPGTYRVLYSVTDHAGHTATSERSVVVKEQPHIHNYSNDWCYGETSHWHECECGERGEEAAHTEDSGTVTKEPTLEEMGVKTYACSVCGYVMRTEILSKLEPEHIHSYGGEWKVDETNHWHECECGERDAVAAHSYGKWITTQAATPVTKGRKERACAVCGYKEVQDIPATGGVSGGGGGGSFGGGAPSVPEPVESAPAVDQLPAESSNRSGWNPFADVTAGDWFHDSVKYVYEQGLMEGTDETHFSPAITTTRAMIATILWRMAGSPAPAARADFHDVAAGQWYTGAVRWAEGNGVVTGYGDGTFGPNDPITREQLALMLYRYAEASGSDGDLTAFIDGDSVSDWAVEAMSWAVDQGIMAGKSGKRLDSQGLATRAETAAMLMRYTRE